MHNLLSYRFDSAAGLNGVIFKVLPSCGLDSSWIEHQAIFFSSTFCHYFDLALLWKTRTYNWD